VGIALSIAMLTAVFVATLTPSPGTPVTASLWCLACGELGALDVAANIVMFVPLGFALALATGRRLRAVLACVATTVLIEALQIGVVVGRDASLSDLLANSVGGWIGCELGLNWRTLVRPVAAVAARLAVTWSVIFALAGMLTSFGLQPATIPKSLWIQRDPPRPSYMPFTGTIQRFDVNGTDLSVQFPPPSLGLDRMLSTEPWRATVTIDRTGLAASRAVLVRVAEEFTVLVSVEQVGWDLHCVGKTRSADFRFRSPKVALGDALGPLDGQSPELRLTCSRMDRAISAGATSTTGTRAETVALSPSLGWLLMSPFDVAVGARLRWMSFLWLAALALPLGYWGAFRSGHATPRRRALVIGSVGAALVTALAISPAIAGVATAAWWEWGAAAAGIASGALLARVVGRVVVAPSTGAGPPPRRR
jgi:hypothetical protein